MAMTAEHAPICGEHRVPKEWRKATFEYQDDGISVRVSEVDVWVCPVDGEASFTPETVDELIPTVRDLVEATRGVRERRPLHAQYVVSVG